jgi:hypothetical protein
MQYRMDEPMNDSNRASVAALSKPGDAAPARPSAPIPPDNSPEPSSGFIAFLRDRSIALPLLALVLFTVALVSPKGNFPLNDDWVYTKSMQSLMETGNTGGHPFAAALTISQMYWGALFCKVFGFSFTTLRVSTLVLGFVGAWATARAALLLGLNRWPAVFCGALIFTSPFVLNLSYTYMSDVPFMTFCALCGLFYLRALHTPSAAAIAWGSLFGSCALLSRQFGGLMPIPLVASAGLFVLQGRYRVSKSMVAAFAGVWFLGGLAFLFFRYTKAPGLEMPIPDAPHSIALRGVNTIHYAATALTYLGLFLIPLAPAYAAVALRTKGQWSKGRIVALFILCAAVSACLWTNGLRRLPQIDIGNMLYDLGVGPMTMSDTYLGLTSWIPLRLGRGWWLFTLAAVLTAGLLLLRAWECVVAALRYEPGNPDADRRARMSLFLLIWGAIMIACPWNPWLPRIFDRYFVGAIVPLLLFLVDQTFLGKKPFVTRFAVVAGLLIYAFSLASLHDYFAWNHARWAVIAELQDQRHISANHIDGGFEFNGMYTSDEFMKLRGTKNFFDSNAGFDGYWVLDNEYVIGITGPRPGHEIVFSVPWTSWLGGAQRQVSAFHRTGPAPAAN